MKVVDLPRVVHQDSIQFLKAIIEDIEAGHFPDLERGALVLNFSGSKYSVWGFGPKGVADHTTMSMLSIGSTLMGDKLIEGK